MIEPNPTMGGAPVRVDGPMSDIPFQVHDLLPVIALCWLMFANGILDYLDRQEHERAQW